MNYIVTDDFKKGSTGLIAFVIAAILAFPILHLIKGDFTWGDFFYQCRTEYRHRHGFGSVLLLWLSDSKEKRQVVLCQTDI